MNAVSVNPWAVLAAAAATFLIGGVWYSPILFHRPWMQAAGLTEADVQRGSPAKVFGGAYLLTVVMAANLAAFLSGPPNLLWGVTAGLLAGVGWVSMALGVTYLFERRPLKLFLVNAGYQVVAFAVMGAILGVWK